MQKEQVVERAVAKGKFEIASEVLHDIGNALVGFGSHANRINRAAGQSNLHPVRNLSVFLKGHQTVIAEAIGREKAEALLQVTDGFAKNQSDNKAEIRKSTAELQNIIGHIQDILNIQRQLVMEHTGLHQREPVDLVKVVDECKSMLFASFDKRGIQFEVEIKPGDYTIKSDHTKLIQVVLNILKNSIEAIGPIISYHSLTGICEVTTVERFWCRSSMISSKEVLLCASKGCNLKSSRINRSARSILFSSARMVCKTGVFNRQY